MINNYSQCETGGMHMITRYYTVVEAARKLEAAGQYYTRSPWRMHGIF